jgi:hypothetical protein
MSLDVYLVVVKPTEVFSANITHNLSKMAEEAGIYYCLWRPEELNITIAKQLINPLRIGLKKMKDNPEKFKAFNPPNGWGTYEHFVPWLEEYINACEAYPEANIKVNR